MLGVNVVFCLAWFGFFMHTNLQREASVTFFKCAMVVVLSDESTK